MSVEDRKNRQSLLSIHHERALGFFFANGRVLVDESFAVYFPKKDEISDSIRILFKWRDISVVHFRCEVKRLTAHDPNWFLSLISHLWVTYFQPGQLNPRFVDEVGKCYVRKNASTNEVDARSIEYMTKYQIEIWESECSKIRLFTLGNQFELRLTIICDRRRNDLQEKWIIMSQDK